VLTDEVRPRRGSAVAPRDASSLILMRIGGDVPSVLLGRRSTAARFMPGYYVFPGGRVGPEDRLESCTNERGSRGPSAHELSLKRAAIRETFEETGLLVGHPVLPTRDRPARTPLERAYEARGLDTAIDALSYIGRAITPRESPMRFNTRFFVADGALAHGELASNGELDDLGWRPIEECRFLPMADVTRFMLEHAMRCRTAARHDLVVYHYVKGVPRVRRETVQER
jgi:8-oxo-dGTP pyrophosphatase MutT (NUDIX family)